MGTHSELGDFLRVRRAALQPEDVGVLNYGIRRVPGLRREELAMLAGVSTTYYTRLEQGFSTNASEAVIEAIGRALNLSKDERLHLFNLARPEKVKRRLPAKPDKVRPGTLTLIQSMPGTPAVVLGRRSEVLAWNALGHRLVAGHVDFEAPQVPASRPNMTRLLFLDHHTRELYARWPEEAGRAVASLRLVAGKSADDQELASLVGELTLKSPEFAKLWARHPVENCMSGVKYLHHPEVGYLELNFEVLTPPDESGHRVLLYAAAPGSPSATTLALLQRPGGMEGVPRGLSAIKS
ncbi:helix-turn-helix domain-containing protein [Paenarthrobacter aurescens]|uniref:Transcriptional regulator n=1 Tax=Paenarthrobacter aurescens TaxID=43663 RepID=A0A4Y3NK33_PAEAU|nr:helix-turn-helix transcriptional regulator [Paenarthrobacter aurescens]MDO6145445.1 helix-turn-helix transcriptional regulator [Paenarthrobacter aurescens]MDO6149250.1 helix-turn-helix transcriptional regulator [Paenarthrobacter aurescens]MDO6160494.1 helix-turn-helix transcriptional regulator [Paenarthrobacter aurescens]MDO6164353.1 helix-turn-helix transcriptional regulator [Paenarthrobacter aurescens]GEB19526.1 transcriptional regulator [Paenarthrobacter aurescens]